MCTRISAVCWKLLRTQGMRSRDFALMHARSCGKLEAETRLGGLLDANF
jgi:hypothetical protein